MSDTEGPTVFKERYELHRRLARGGMSDVYLARDIVLDRPVAVKVLFPEFARDATFVERFRREAQAAARLSDGHIVAIYDWGEELGTYFIAMEYVDGRSLSEVIRAEGTLPPKRAAEIAAQAAGALEAAHRAGVVHRDVKPGNILLTPQGQVKVADFGIAQALSSSEQLSLTQTGAVMGTATYFSPEQAQGHQVDARTDLYSLGCVLYEMLTGRPPFSGDTPVAIAYMHVQNQPDPPSARGVEVPPDLEAIIMKLLRKEPSARYASAADLRDELEHYLDGSEVAAAAEPIVEAQPTAAMATTAMAGAAGGAIATGTVAAAATPPDAYDSLPPTRRGRSGWLVAITVLLLIILAAALFQIGSNLSSDQEVLLDVPTVNNLTRERAEEILRTEGFEVEVIEEINANITRGQVFAQDPAGGTKAPEGSTVQITVSLGVGEAQVPDVVGLTVEAARVRLRDADFAVNEDERSHDRVPAGEVISQNPRAGDTAERGSRVTIVVSTGPAGVEIPSVAGQNEASALNTLERLDLVVTVERRSDDSVPAGQVIGTRPSAGTEVPAGGAVALIVSTGPAPTTTTTTPPTTPTTEPTTTTTAEPTTPTPTTTPPTTTT
ncbi:MAG: Stk1 family PASTA domain-containing Ser/Thr kinase, partial [Acidimicrobiia bacterium]|nr:Stk1 family PASTA domain-containing Ser/Thr kinase [Acidimicrobiia bacterium]